MTCSSPRRCLALCALQVRFRKRSSDLNRIQTFVPQDSLQIEHASAFAQEVDGKGVTELVDCGAPQTKTPCAFGARGFVCLAPRGRPELPTFPLTAEGEDFQICNAMVSTFGHPAQR